MRLRFLLARRDPPVPSEIVLAAQDLLRRRGFCVEEVIPEEALLAVDAPPDDDVLWLHKSYSELALQVAGALHAGGARLLNPYRATAALRSKIVAAQVLAAAGVPAPRTWAVGDPRALGPLLARSPLVVKPAAGWRGQGVSFVRTAAALAALPPFEAPMVAQELVDGPGEDLRLYVAGERVFATRKPFSGGSYAVAGRPAPVTPRLEELALRVGAAFGLALFGLDLVEGSAGPVVVDVNHFPGYKGCPGAAEAVAHVIAAAATGRAALPAADACAAGGAP
jgi:ribosomal protein S6--L-glutamate ligase